MSLAGTARGDVYEVVPRLPTEAIYVSKTVFKTAFKALPLVFALSATWFAAVSTAASAARRRRGFPFHLGNGLEVVVVPDHRAPVVTHMIWYKVGAADETPGKSGLAHFLEHLMFKGTAQNPGNSFSQEVAAIGGQENAFTSSDYTGFFQRVPREHLKEMMAFEADRITGLVLTDDVVRPELNVVLEEQNMRVANNPNSRLAEQMDAALYLNHPYGRPVIGWRPEIESLDRDDALAFYRRFYTPNNAIVVIAGDVTSDEVKADAEETYGKIARRAEIAPRQRPKEPPQEAPRTVTLADARVEQPSVNRYYLVPSRTNAKPGESEALEVLAHVLGCWLEQPSLSRPRRRAGQWRSMPAPIIRGRRSTMASLACSARRSRARRCTMSRRPSTPCWPMSANTASPPTNSISPRTG